MKTQKIVRPKRADTEEKFLKELDGLYTFLESVAARDSSSNSRNLATRFKRIIEIIRDGETKTELPPPSHHA